MTALSSRAAAVTVLLAAAGVPVAQADTIYVDANCPGGDGSELDPYCSIQTPWDCTQTADGFVGISDFLLLLAQWDSPGTCDFDGGGVGITDFLELLADWGPCP